MTSRHIEASQDSPPGTPPGAAEHGARQGLKLCHRPGTVAILDDHPAFVEMLTAALERSVRVQPFESPQRCAEFLQQDTARWHADMLAQERVLDAWRGGAALIPSILDYWSASGDTRRGLAKVLVVDDHMPGMDGLDMLAQLPDWPGQRLLLGTKAYDQAAVVHALNRGLIDKYVGKHAKDFPAVIRASVTELYDREDAQCRQLWARTLTPDQQKMLARQDIACALSARLASEFDEWLVLGQPFGVVGLSDQRQPFWLPLSLSDDCAEWGAPTAVTAIVPAFDAQHADARGGG